MMEQVSLKLIFSWKNPYSWLAVAGALISTAADKVSKWASAKMWKVDI